MKTRFFCIFLCVLCFISVISVNAQALGDVNSSGTIDIVDALLVAQYYVGLNPADFVSAVGDVNCSGGIDIVDALVIAQYYVGLISQFPCSQTSAPTAVTTIAPTSAPGSPDIPWDWGTYDRHRSEPSRRPERHSGQPENTALFQPQTFNRKSGVAG
jgi:hypothetical protein